MKRLLHPVPSAHAITYLKSSPKHSAIPCINLKSSPKHSATPSTHLNRCPFPSVVKHLLISLLVCFAVLLSIGNKPAVAQNQWEDLGVPFMAQIDQMVSSPNGSIFIVGWKTSQSCKVFRSDDQGLSWSALDLPQGFYRLAVNKDGVIFMIDRTRIYRSVDNGESWVQIGEGPSMFSTIAVSASGFIAVGNIDWHGPFVMVSFDNGNSWVPKHFMGYTEQLYLYFKNETLYRATENYLARSLDYGESFQDISIPGYFGQSSHNAMAFGTHGEIYYGMSWGNGIYKSTDKGDSWERIFNTGTHTIAVNSNDEVFAGKYRSADGINWTVMEEFIHTGVSNILIADDDVIYVASNYGIKVSDDNGQTWRTSNRGLVDAEIEGIESYQEHVFLVKNGRVFHSADNGDTWELCQMSLSDFLGFTLSYQIESVKISPTGEVYAFCLYESWDEENSVVLRSMDFGKTWESVLSRQLSDLAFGRDQSMLMLTELDFFRSFDDGIHWEKMTNLPECFTPVRVVADQTGNIYVNSPVCSPAAIFRSTDHGSNWIVSYLPEGAKADRLYLNSRGDVYAHKTLGGIYVSEDQGGSWNQLNTESLFQQVVVMETDDYDNIFVSTEEGLFMSLDYGGTWIPLHSEIPAGSSVNYLSAGGNGYVYASTKTGKVYRYQLRVDADKHFATKMNIYPNPATDFVNLKMDDARTGLTEDINIFNISGRLVKSFTLNNGTATVDINSLDAGAYIVSGQRVSQKLVIK